MARVILEGCDKTGKSTIIKELCKKLKEPHLVIKYSAPHSDLPPEQQKTVQIRNIVDGITALNMFDNVIMDRFSGGEYVYAPLKRNYDGEYIFRYEREIPHNTLLVVLTAPDKLIKERFDHVFITEEEIPIVNAKFMEYFQRTPILNKICIDTSDPIEKCVEKILKEVELIQKNIPKLQRPFGRLEEMFMKQIEFQKSLGNKFDQNFISTQTLAAMVELGEFIQETPWKTWKQNQKLNREKAIEELVDVWHFIINLSLAFDLSAEELYMAFMSKNKKNFKRQEDGY